MNTTTDYEQQAIDFLQSTNTDFKAEFLKHGKHFDDDKDERDIYRITLKRGTRFYSFDFGQSLNNSGKWIVKDYNPKLTKVFNDKGLATSYAAKIGNSFNVRLNPNQKAPTAYDVLACLTKYDPGTFEDFCSEFGYDTDSKRAEKTYNAVKDEYMNVCALFNDTEIEALQEIS